MNISGQNNLNLHSSFSRFNQSTNQEHNLDMLFKKEKEFKKMIKMKKLKKIEFFNTLHSSFLKDKLNSLYLTDSNSMQDEGFSNARDESFGKSLNAITELTDESLIH